MGTASFYYFFSCRKDLKWCKTVSLLPGLFQYIAINLHQMMNIIHKREVDGNESGEVSCAFFK